MAVDDARNHSPEIRITEESRLIIPDPQLEFYRPKTFYKTRVASLDGSECTIFHRYLMDDHRYMMSPTKADADVPFVQLGRRTLLWICRWKSVRWNERPSIPDPTPYVRDWVLLKAMPAPVSIVTKPDGKPEYRIMGTYIYGHKKPNVQNFYQDVKFPLAAWLSNVFDRDIPSAYFDKTLLDAPKGVLQ